jgi:hypothetical protein
MKIDSRTCFVLCLALLLGNNCTTPYNPPSIKGNNQFLVVDGFINNGPDSTIFILSRSANLGDTAGPQPELSATVTVVGQQSGVFPLINMGNGKYAVDQLNLDNSQNYQVQITASNGEQYVSDFVPLRPSPPIYSLLWRTDSTGVTIYLNTHDPTNSTRYYQWNFTQTWEHDAFFASYLDYVNGQMVARDPANQIFRCWSTTGSTDILISTTAGLAEDAVYQYPINSIVQGSVQLSILYSIEVKQNALTEEGYNYWLTLKQNTEKLGGIFSPLPSELTGNLHCLTNPKEPVLGYLSAGTVSTLRIFIDHYQLGYWTWFPPICDTDSIPQAAFAQVFADSLLFTPLNDIGPGGVAGTDPICGDCRYGGGTNVKPPFWPN